MTATQSRLSAGGRRRAYRAALAELSEANCWRGKLRRVERQVAPEPIFRNQSEDEYDRRLVARPALRRAKVDEADRGSL